MNFINKSCCSTILLDLRRSKKRTFNGFLQAFGVLEDVQKSTTDWNELTAKVAKNLKVPLELLFVDAGDTAAGT